MELAINNQITFTRYFIMMNTRIKSLFIILLLSFFSIQVFAAENCRDAKLVTIKPACLKEEVLASPAQPKDSLSSTEKTGYLRKNLNLNKIILEVDAPGDYFFGIFPENDKNKIPTINNDILMPLGKVTVFDLTNKKLVSIVDLESADKTFGGNIDRVSGILFMLHLAKNSQYLITPEIYVNTEKKIDNKYVFFIKKKGFVK